MISRELIVYFATSSPGRPPEAADKVERSEAYSGPVFLDDEGTIRRHGEAERVDCPYLVDIVRRRRIDRGFRRHLQGIIDKSFRQSLELADVELAGGTQMSCRPHHLSLKVGRLFSTDARS